MGVQKQHRWNPLPRNTHVHTAHHFRVTALGIGNIREQLVVGTVTMRISRNDHAL